MELGGITYLEDKNLRNEELVNITLLTNNIQKIYKTTEKLAKKLEIDEIKEIKETRENFILNEFIGNFNIIKKTDKIKLEKNKEPVIQEAEPAEKEIEGLPEIQEKLNPKSNKEKEAPSVLKYNTTLLNYAGVLDADTEFITKILKIGIPIILLIMIVSAVMLYTSFKITYSSRIKEFGMLSSLGMNKKQRNKIIRKESIILGLIRYCNRNNHRNCSFILFNKNNRYNARKLCI